MERSDAEDATRIQLTDIMFGMSTLGENLGAQTLLEYKDKARPFDPAYAKRLKQYLARNDQTIFAEVIEVMLRNGIRLEQEVLVRTEPAHLAATNKDV